jgi:hypothetical protein
MSTTNEIGYVEPMSRGPSIPGSHDHLLGVDENPIEIEKNRAAANDWLRYQDPLVEPITVDATIRSHLSTATFAITSPSRIPSTTSMPSMTSANTV